jgi:uncharacterized protein YbdZ (MbtH family)
MQTKVTQQGLKVSLAHQDDGCIWTALAQRPQGWQIHHHIA